MQINNRNRNRNRNDDDDDDDGVVLMEVDEPMGGRRMNDEDVDSLQEEEEDEEVTQRTRDAYDEDRTVVVPTNANLDQIRAGARVQCELDAAAGQTAQYELLEQVAQSSSFKDALAKLGVSLSYDAKIKLERQIEQAKEAQVKANDQMTSQVFRDRFVPVDNQCPNERADRTICGRSMKPTQSQCSQCRSAEIRKPSGMSTETWHKEKHRRSKKRRAEHNARRKRNVERRQAKAKAKKLKVATSPADAAGADAAAGAAGIDAAGAACADAAGAAAASA